MAQIIGLPKLSPTMEEGVLVRWVKKEGDAVEPGDLVAEVETDKANMDFNLEDEGVLLRLLVAEGETVKLGAPVAILGEAGEDISALEAEAKQTLTGGAPAPAVQPPAHPERSPGQAGTQSKEPASASAVQPPAHPERSPGALRQAQDVRPGAESEGPALRQAQGERTTRLLASPLAKTLAIELGVDLRTLHGSGPGGRIVERDVRAAQGSGAPEQVPFPASPQAGGAAHPAARAIGDAAAAFSAQQSDAPAGSTALALFRSGGGGGVPSVLSPSDEYVDTPLSNIRKTIAARMTEAKRDVPHFYLTRELDTGKLLDFRARLNELLGDRGKVSVNDLVMKGVALALRRVPECNAAFMGDAIRYYTRVHLGVAVATERGLITPVVRDADLKGIGVIAAEVRELAKRARDRQLKTHEIQGSTFSVSNLGMFGISHFEAIINPPEAAILALGTVREVPVVKNGQLAVGKLMSVTLSCDHRVIDGALGARFLIELADIVEKPESLAL